MIVRSYTYPEPYVKKAPRVTALRVMIALGGLSWFIIALFWAGVMIGQGG
jgi:hypothetical protein